MLTTGSMLQNRYRVARILGQGGMGAVYRAWDTRLNISVAIKEMVPQPGLNPHTLAELRVQFKQEAAILARLQHPNLVRVTDFFEENDNDYLVMDFVEGESLGERIVREGMISETNLLSWAGQLLDALAYCHDQGVLHRDIKPQNVIIRADGRAILVDFGLVKLWDPKDPQTRTAMRGMGTPEYAPPEQYDSQNSHTDPRSDVYSLGALLYHALTGRIPPTATRRIVDTEALMPIEAVNPHVSQRTRQVIARSIKLRPDERFPNAREMAAALAGGTPALDTQSRSPRTLTLPEEQQIPPAPHSPPGSNRPPSPQPPVPPKSNNYYPVTEPSPSRPGIPGFVWAIGGIIMTLILCGGGIVGLGYLLDSANPTATAGEPNTPTPRATRTPRPVSPVRGTETAEAAQGESLLTEAEDWDLLFSDSFDMDQNNWLVGEASDEWADVNKVIEDGKFHWEATAKQAFLSWGTPDTDPVDDFYASIEVRRIEGPENTQYGIIFRRDDTGSYYLFQISGNTFTLFRWSGERSKWTTLIAAQKTDALVPSRTNRLTVVGEGSHFIFGINGKYVGEYTDDTLAEGKVGVMIGLTEAGDSATVEFDNFELRTP